MALAPSIKAREYCLATGLFKDSQEFDALVTGFATKYLEDPVVREAKRNRASHLHWSLRDYKARALLIYVTGVESPAPCQLCLQTNRGYFSKCVVSRRKGDATSQLSCANCVYNGHPHRCSFIEPSGGGGGGGGSTLRAPERHSSASALSRSPSFIEEDSDQQDDQATRVSHYGALQVASDSEGRPDDGSDHGRNTTVISGQYPIRPHRARAKRPPGLSAASVPNMKRASQPAPSSSHLENKASRRSLPPSEPVPPPRHTSNRTSAILELAEPSQQYKHQRDDHSHHAPQPPATDSIHFLDDFPIYLSYYRRYYENMSSEQRARERVLRNMEISVIDAIEMTKNARKRRRLE